MVLATDWVCEYSDLDQLGVDYKAADDRFLGFPSAEHHDQDKNHAHYQLAWGSLDGVDTEVGFTVKMQEEVQCCEEIVTRIHCWIQPLRLC